MQGATSPTRNNLGFSVLPKKRQRLEIEPPIAVTAAQIKEELIKSN